VDSAGLRADGRVATVVAVGGAAGALTRWALTVAVPWEPPSLPVATLTANLLGCLVIGVLLTVWLEGSPPAWWVRPFAAIGFVGGFTTFSAFAVEGVRLVEQGALPVAAGYVAASVLLGLLLVRVGVVSARWALGTGAGGA
jgi:CrcB protein